MPSARTLRAKKNYVRNADKIKSKQKEYFKQKGKANYQKNQNQKKRLHVPTQRLVITLSQRKKVASRAYSRASYSSRPEKKKVASRANSRASYNSEPEKKKAASRAYSKTSYGIEPEKKKAASRAYSKARYSIEPRIKKLFYMCILLI